MNAEMSDGFKESRPMALFLFTGTGNDHDYESELAFHTGVFYVCGERW